MKIKNVAVALSATVALGTSGLADALPTLDEAGVKGYEMSYWNAAYVPAKTPEPIVKRLNELLINAMGKESVKSFVQRGGMEVYTTTPADMASFQAAEAQRWSDIIKRANIQPD